MPSLPRIVIIGGGIAGLAAAWECHRRGLVAQVLEASPRAGGVIGTDHIDDLVVDAGPDAFLVQKPGAVTLCRELGIEHELVEMRPPRRAFIVSGGRFHVLPDGASFGLPTRASAFARSSLLSWSGKVRVAMEPLIPARATSGSEDESAGAFLTRRFGQQATRRIAQPLLGGIHAGDLGTLSARAIVPQFVAIEAQRRSVLLALRRQSRARMPGGPFRSFAAGMGRLPAALVAALPPGSVHTSTSVQSLATHGGEFDVTTPAGTYRADIVLLAVPASPAAQLLSTVAPEAAALAATVPYVSSATVLLAYRSATIGAPLDGSGYVVADPPDATHPIALTWVTRKWPGRAPDDTTLLRVFFGGAGREAVVDATDAVLIRHAHAHVATHFAVTSPPTWQAVYRWRRTSPQHTVGHLDRVQTLQARLDALPGLGVAGSGFRAIGIPDVVSDARREVGRLLDDWHRRYHAADA
jgi:protoporphyrinogen/coproporphyrinogen III oxidase